MNTMSAFAMGMATCGNKVKRFNAEKIIKLMKEHKVKEAEIYLSGDRGWTETDVWLKGKKLYGRSMGVDGSTWAMPMLDIDGTKYEVGNYKKCNIVWKGGL